MVKRAVCIVLCIPSRNEWTMLALRNLYLTMGSYSQLNTTDYIPGFVGVVILQLLDPLIVFLFLSLY